MNIINFTKQFIKENKKEFLISIFVLSVGSFFIHLKQNNGTPNIPQFIVYLPVSWFLLIFLGLLMGIFLYKENY